MYVHTKTYLLLLHLYGMNTTDLHYNLQSSPDFVCTYVLKQGATEGDIVLTLSVCMYIPKCTTTLQNPLKPLETPKNPPKPPETLKNPLNPLKPPYLSPVSSVIFLLLLGNITQIININLICQKVVSRGQISIFCRHFIYSNFKSLTKYSALKIFKFCL